MSDPTGPAALAPETSPLIEADPNSLEQFIQERVDKIFNTPPLELTDEDLRVQVRYYRKNRERFLLESQEKENRPPKTRRSGATPKSVAEAIALTTDLL